MWSKATTNDANCCCTSMDLSAIAPDASEASEHVRTLRGKSFGSITPSLSTPESLMGTPPTVAVLFFGGIIVPYDGVKHTIRRSARRARPKLQHTLYESVFPEDCYCESGGTSRLSTGFGCVWGGVQVFTLRLWELGIIALRVCGSGS